MNYKEKVLSLIQNGKIVCPETKGKLVISGNSLQTSDNKISYKFDNGVPIFLDLAKQTDYLEENEGKMFTEYTETKTGGLVSWLNNKLNKTIKDYPTPESRVSFNKVFENGTEDQVFLSVGGGPRRAHPKVLNLNIGSFNNVEVVADAYQLPFQDNCIDGIFCGAVIEHLEFPDKAVQEIFRVLKPNGKIYCDIPFLQSYHGYPNHFQNFTLTGHVRLYERAGFKVLDSGVCVGATYMFGEIGYKFLKVLKPKIVSKILSTLFLIVLAPFRKIDNRLNKDSDAYVLASTTYVLAEKK